MCYCGHVTPIATRSRVVILQHPRERDVPINTARIAALSLLSAELHVGVSFDGSAALARALADPERPAVLLYPDGPEAGEGAGRGESAPAAPPGPVTLVVLDGTWSQAKKLLRSNPALQRLPRYGLRPPRPSDYRIRREPREDYVSTIEAIAHVLAEIEGEGAGGDALLAPFRAMVDAQVAHAARGGGRPRMLARPRPPRDPRARLPPVLRERAADLVCVHAEANAWPVGSPERAAGMGELVHLAACRAGSGEVFEALLAPVAPIAPATTKHCEISEAELRAGMPRDRFLEAWAAFVRPADVLCAWGAYAPELLARTGAPWAGDAIDIRRAARLYACSNVGASEAFAARFTEGPLAALGRGRAGRRLAELVTVARALSA